MVSQRQRSRDRYTVDLVDLHSLCEANYARLRQIFRDYEQCNAREFTVKGARIHLEVIERSRYTTTFRLVQSGVLKLPAGTVRLDVRMYHDARMAEVVGFQSHQQIAGRYPYPNPQMYQRDEKQQQNQYVAELLSHCLAEGTEPRAAEFVADR